MKQYKHKQTKELAIECPENGPLARYKINHGFIAAHFVENTQDWEEIKPAFFTTHDGVDIAEKTVVHWVTYNSSSKPVYMYPLLFSQGHKIYNWADSNPTYYVFSTYETAMAYIESKTPKVLYVTEDGVEIFSSTEYSKLWGVGLQCTPDWVLKEGWRNTRKNCTSTPSMNRKWFHSKEKAKYYILMNSPCLSINDIQEAMYIPEDFDADNVLKVLKEIVKKKYDNK